MKVILLMVTFALGENAFVSYLNYLETRSPRPETTPSTSYSEFHYYSDYNITGSEEEALQSSWDLSMAAFWGTDYWASITSEISDVSNPETETETETETEMETEMETSSESLTETISKTISSSESQTETQSTTLSDAGTNFFDSSGTVFVLFLGILLFLL